MTPRRTDGWAVHAPSGTTCIAAAETTIAIEGIQIVTCPAQGIVMGVRPTSWAERLEASRSHVAAIKPEGAD